MAYEQDECAVAAERFIRQLAMVRGLGDRVREGQALCNLGNVYRMMGERERAVDCYEQAQAIARAVGDRLGEAVARLEEM